MLVSDAAFANACNHYRYKTESTTGMVVEEPDVVAETAVLIEAETGAILYSKDCHKKLYPASITKIMTALLVLENCNMEDKLVFTDEIVDSIPYDAAKMGAVANEEISIKDAMYALMLRSYNDVAVGLAYHVAGSQDAFAKKMTERAHEIGALNTNFMNSSGLHHDEHYTTAYDMAIITREAMGNSSFAEISGTVTYRILPTNMYQYRRTLNNRHELLATDSADFYPYAIAGKTGYTSDAGRTLVTVARKDGLTLICVIMKSDYDSSGKDSKKILDYGFENFKKTSIRESEGSFDKNFFSEMGEAFISPQSALYIDKDTSIMMPEGATIEDFTKKTVYYDTMRQGVIGELQYYYGDKLMGKVDILAGTGTNGDISDTPENEETGTLDTDSVFDGDSRIPINIWLIPLGILVIIVIVAIIVYIVKTKEKRKRKKERKRIFKESRRRFKSRKKYR
jgi:D-alanyl-D-alanine carboxypeptidase